MGSPLSYKIPIPATFIRSYRLNLQERNNESKQLQSRKRSRGARESSEGADK